MIIDFWNTKLNPITMLPRETDAMYCKNRYVKKENNYVSVSKDLSINPEYILVKTVVEKLGVGAKSISSYIRNLGIEKTSYKSGDLTYYKVEDINRISIPSKVKQGSPEEYISSKDLQVELNLTINQLFRMAQQKNWKKVRFSKNIVYYLKEQVLNKC